jgi:hypothetical protein
MATLTLTNLPPDALAYLAARAARANRTVEEEVLAVIEEELARPGDGDTGPLDFPRPLDGPQVVLAVRPGGERLPEPLAVEETRPE